MARLCRECRWTRQPGSEFVLVVCDHPSSRFRTRGRYQRACCQGARLPPKAGEDLCGPEGKYWEPVGVANRKRRDRRISGVEPSNINDVVVEL